MTSNIRPTKGNRNPGSRGLNRAIRRNPGMKDNAPDNPPRRKLGMRADTPLRNPGTKDNTPYFEMVNLRIHEIRCIKNTLEVGLDEIKVAAIKVESKLEKPAGKERLAAKAEGGEILSAGKFKNGDNRQFNPPRTVATFHSGGKGVGWPRYYHGMFVFFEEDKGSIGEIVNAAVQAVEKQATAAISKTVSTEATAAMGAAAGTAIGSIIPGVGNAVGAAVGVAVGLAAAAINKGREHDVFPPCRVYLKLDRFPDRAGEIESHTADFEGFKGHYRMRYSWEMK